MGGGISKNKRIVSLMLVGLDNAGKTTFVQWFKQNINSRQAGTAHAQTIPTVGYSMEKFVKGNYEYKIFDMSGQSKYREMWNSYCKEIEGIIFLIDSSDTLRLQVVANELETLLELEEIRNRPVPILFVANKADVQGAFSPESLKEMLNLKAISDRKWEIFQTNSIKGWNIDSAFNWLSNQVATAFPNSKSS